MSLPSLYVRAAERHKPVRPPSGQSRRALFEIGRVVPRRSTDSGRRCTLEPADALQQLRKTQERRRRASPARHLDGGIAPDGLSRRNRARHAALGDDLRTVCSKLPAAAVRELPPGRTAEEGASSFVNPMTALSFVETMRAEGHRALVHTAGPDMPGNRVLLVLVIAGLLGGLDLAFLVQAPNRLLSGNPIPLSAVAQWFNVPESELRTWMHIEESEESVRQENPAEAVEAVSVHPLPQPQPAVPRRSPPVRRAPTTQSFSQPTMAGRGPGPSSPLSLRDTFQAVLAR